VDSVALIKDTNIINPSPCGGTLSLISKATDTVWKLPPDTALPPCGEISTMDMTLITNACWIFRAHYLSFSDTAITPADSTVSPPIPADTVITVYPEKWVFGPCNVNINTLCYMTCKVCQDNPGSGPVTIMRFNCTYQNSGIPDCQTLNYDPRNPPFPDMPAECFKVPCAEHP
jgi:hypothetical protein